jgi:hypothetical protein
VHGFAGRRDIQGFGDPINKVICPDVHPQRELVRVDVLPGEPEPPIESI